MYGGDSGKMNSKLEATPVMREVSLSDKFDVMQGAIFITGKQSLARLPLLQRLLDERRGLRTAGYISGYRGSPLGTVDNELLKIADRLKAADIVFQPGLNEDLAMTAVWGSQQLDFVPGRRVDGVFGMWYGKGPGVDRSGDAIKHANMSGTHPNGGVLLVFGDDHAGKSSSLAHQSDLALAAHEVPILYPSDVHDIFKFGLAGFAMSRETGLLAGLKLVNETADCTQAMEFCLDQFAPVLDTTPSAHNDVSIRVEMLAVTAQDQRMVRNKLPRVHAFTRRNAIDSVAFGSDRPSRLGIVTAGKAFQDVIDGLRLLGIDAAAARRLGIGVLKVGLIYPLDPEPLNAFVRDASEFFFVEEKRPHMELQAAALLYHSARRPNISGKLTPEGEALLPADEPLDAATVASAVGRRLLDVSSADSLDLAALRVAFDGLSGRAASFRQIDVGPLARRPVFCSGCPHNRSTKLPDGSFGVAGIGCHGLVQFMDRNPLPCTHMGAEGVNWIGLSHFTDTKHVFVNLGDGTFSHSGSLAIRAAAASDANVTFKILANDVVAMTGGQAVESGLSVGAMVRQVLLEGAKRVVVVAEDPDAVRSGKSLPTQVKVVHRTHMENVQRELREVPGTTVIVYVQICATEKRKRRKRGKVAVASKRVVINPAVCEGCGDCSRASNCMSVQPLETEFGHKRRIDQASCNSDMSCLEGFCPSFVTIEDGVLNRPKPINVEEAAAHLPKPVSRKPNGEFGVLLAGIGGTGVVTASAIVGMAAHLEGRGVGIYDMRGLAQKGGAVYSHLRILPSPTSVAPMRLGLEDADLLIASDVVAATQLDSLKTVGRATTVLVDDQVVATQAFHENGNVDLDAERLVRRLEKRAEKKPVRMPANDLARRAFGDPIFANMIMLGYAFQMGALPLSLDAVEQAIRINGADVAGTLRAFRLGRLAFADPEAAEALLATDEPAMSMAPKPVETLQQRVAVRVRALRAYQDAAYAERFRLLVERVRAAEDKVATGSTRLTEAVAANAFRLMAYKDEYEVARLLSEPSFWEGIRRRFDGGSLKLHLAPPILSGRDPASGRPRKMAFSATLLLPVLRLLARFKGLRGSLFDPFGWMQERKTERRLRDEYLGMVEEILAKLHDSNIEAAIVLASYPREIRGYGPVKENSIARVEPMAKALRLRFSEGSGNELTTAA
jgi:indolepyruvate ferredoxin oxidoreductase